MLVSASHFSWSAKQFLIFVSIITGKKDKGAPDLSNENNFPSLSAAVAIEQNAFKLKKYYTTSHFHID